jgi:hypothetical protein
MEARDFELAQSLLSELHSRRGGAALRLASMMARWTPSLLARAYTARRARLIAQAAQSGGAA